MTQILEALQTRLPEMTRDLEYFVNTESPSANHEYLRRCADVLDEIAEPLLGTTAERETVDGWPHLVWSFGDPKVLIVGHYDTVWPEETVDRWPFAIDGDHMTGPGVFDMKGGIIQTMHALSEGGVPDGVTLLITADEEIGSLSSLAMIESLSRQCEAALVIEPGHHGAIKTARKGVSFYEFAIAGKAAHAGLEPEKGSNALEELAHRVIHAQSLGRPDIGTTVNATVGHAGTTVNVIPAKATLAIDVRAETKDEQQRVDDALRNFVPVVPGTTCVLERGGINRPPFEETSSAALYEAAKAVAPLAGIENLTAIKVGGGSDGNFTAAVGTPTLDGLGIVGDGAHAEGEWGSQSSMAERGALTRLLVDRLLGAS